jgi:hypothetical protein
MAVTAYSLPWQQYETLSGRVRFQYFMMNHEGSIYSLNYLGKRLDISYLRKESSY